MNKFFKYNNQYAISVDNNFYQNTLHFWFPYIFFKFRSQNNTRIVNLISSSECTRSISNTLYFDFVGAYEKFHRNLIKDDYL